MDSGLEEALARHRRPRAARACACQMQVNVVVRGAHQVELTAVGAHERSHELRQRPHDLPAHGGLADREVVGQVGHPGPTHFLDTHQQSVRGGIDVGVHLPGQRTGGSAGPAHEHRDLAFQRRERVEGGPCGYPGHRCHEPVPSVGLITDHWI